MNLLNLSFYFKKKDSQKREIQLTCILHLKKMLNFLTWLWSITLKQTPMLLLWRLLSSRLRIGKFMFSRIFWENNEVTDILARKALGLSSAIHLYHSDIEDFREVIMLCNSLQASGQLLLKRERLNYM